MLLCWRRDRRALLRRVSDVLLSLGVAFPPARPATRTLGGGGWAGVAAQWLPPASLKHDACGTLPNDATGVAR